MTTIAGIQGIDYAVLVADSQITEDNLVTLATSTPKIVEVGKFLVGISGDTRPGDILSYNWKPPLFGKRAFIKDRPATYPHNVTRSQVSLLVRPFSG